MDTKGKFNDIMRSKFAERQLPFDEANWENIKQMVERSRKKEKQKRWAIIFGAGLLVGIGIMVPFFIILKTNYENKLTDNTRKEILPTKDKNEIFGEDNNLIKKERNTAAYTDINTTDKKSDKLFATANRVIEKKNNIVSSEVMKQESKIENDTIISQINSGGLREEKTLTTASVKNKIENQNSISAITSNTAKQESSDTITLNSVEKKEQNQTIESVSSEKNTVLVLEKTKLANDTTYTQQKEVKENNAQLMPDTASAPHVLVSVTASDTSHKINNDPATLTQNNIQLQIAEGKQLVKKNNISIEAGAGFAAGWNYHDTTEARGLNPILGIGFTHIVNSTWSFQIGIQGSTVGHLNASRHIIKHINNDFGYNSADSIIETKWLYYVSFPFRIHYNFNAKNSIGVGVVVSHLINGYGKITSYNQSNDKGITNQKEIWQTGYVKGFNEWNAVFMLSYRKKLSNKISASIIPYFGFMDIKNNSFFRREKFERDMGVKLLFSYDIF